MEASGHGWTSFLRAGPLPALPALARLAPAGREGSALPSPPLCARAVLLSFILVIQALRTKGETEAQRDSRICPRTVGAGVRM